MKDTINFDMDAAIKALREGKDLSGKDGVLTPLIKQLTEAAMQAELKTPRDRAGTFEPQIVKKHQTYLTDELERKVIALFALGKVPVQVQG